MYNNAAEVYLMPRAGLVLAQKLVEKKCNVLLIFDKIIDYDVKEKQIFDNAKQPFAPTNIFSEIMENCGDFGPGKGKMTSVVVADTDTLNIEHERSMTNLRIHLESIADQIIEFEPSFKSMKSSLPKLDLLTFTGFNQDYWQKPLIASIRKDLENFSHLLKDAYRSNKNKRDYGIQEDPWENYLYHDSQFIIPLINHQEPLDIITQILLFKFIHRTVGDDAYADSDWNECISEHLQKPKDLIASLKHFSKSYDEFPNQRTISDIIQTHLNSEFPKNSFEDWNIAEEEVFKINEQIDQFLKMFYMNAKINGGLRPHKLDYWKNIV